MLLRRSSDGLLEEWEVEGGGTPRPPRYALPLPVSVRTAGSGQWLEGMIANASRTGILFVSDACWPPETRIELRFRLGAAVEGDGAVECAGVVVRSTSASGPGGRGAMAAMISAYRFVGRSDTAGTSDVK